MGEGQEIRLRDVNKDSAVNGEKTANGGKYLANQTEDEEQGKCSRIHDSCSKFCIPCLRSHNPLPEDAGLCRRIRDAFMLPPKGNLAFYIQFAVVMLQIWIVLYSLTHTEALPGGNFYSLLVLFICCAIGGYLISFINLPPLLGMLILGLLLRNVPGIKYVGEHIDSKWSGALRKIALTVILTRAGLGLDIVKLKKLSWAVLRLAFMPCAVEIITVGIVSHFLLGFPWVWSMMMGCILGALSPAVTVPSLVNLQDRRYGVAKGIPTMLLAAGGLDNVLCVTGFSVFMGIIFSHGDLAVTIIKGPVGVLVGIVYGFIAGIFLWYFPSKDCSNPVFYRSLMLISSGLIAIFGSSTIDLSGAGPLGCLTTATVAAYKWRQRRQPGETDEIAGVMALAWLIMQHFLFGLIGTAVNVSNIQSNTAGLGIGTLAIGLVLRSVMSSLVTMGTGFNFKERAFITLTWLSKATVQAAIGGLALDKVMESDTPNEDYVRYATDILTISVLAIIICAPTGATLMAVLGPKFLVQGDAEEVDVTVEKEEDKHEEEKTVPVEIRESVDVVSEKDSLRGSRSSLDNEVFKSELSMVLQNRRKSEEGTLGIDNPAFDAEMNNRPKLSSSSSASASPPSPKLTMALTPPTKFEVTTDKGTNALETVSSATEVSSLVTQDFASSNANTTEEDISSPKENVSNTLDQLTEAQNSDGQITVEVLAIDENYDNGPVYDSVAVEDDENDPNSENVNNTFSGVDIYKEDGKYKTVLDVSNTSGSNNVSET